MHIRELPKRLVQEIEMLKIVLNLIAMSKKRNRKSPSRFEGTVHSLVWWKLSVVLVTPMLIYSGNIKIN